MFFDLTYDAEGNVTDVVLKPGESEDADKLHDYACILRVDNPALRFSDKAKAGGFDHLDDAEYEKLLNKIKLISGNMFENKAQINIFRLVVMLLDHILKE